MPPSEVLVGHALQDRFGDREVHVGVRVQALAGAGKVRPGRDQDATCGEERSSSRPWCTRVEVTCSLEAKPNLLLYGQTWYNPLLAVLSGTVLGCSYSGS
jgi:hypothetical protein